MEDEVSGLAQAQERPGLAEIARALGRLLDNPKAASQHAAAAGKLADVLDRLHKGADQRKSRLATVQQMTRPVEQPGS